MKNLKFIFNFKDNYSTLKENFFEIKNKTKY